MKISYPCRVEIQSVEFQPLARWSRCIVRATISPDGGVPEKGMKVHMEFSPDPDAMKGLLKLIEDHVRENILRDRDEVIG